MSTSQKHYYQHREVVPEEITVDYEKAIQNLTDILIDNDKFFHMSRVLYDACDTDNNGSIDVAVIEEFVRSSMRGNQVEGMVNSSFETENLCVIELLQENEAGELSFIELMRFLNELFKNQVIMLKNRIEDEKHKRCLEYIDGH